MRQWQQAKAKKSVERGWANHAWIVPLSSVLKDRSLIGYALFLIGDPDSAAEDRPSLGGIFDSAIEAKASLESNGVYREL